MKRLTVSLAFLFVLSFALRAATPVELFQKAKALYAGGAYSDALATLGELEKESQKPENEAVRGQLTPALTFYRGACLAELGKSSEAQARFAQYLAAQPNAAIDKAAFPRKTFEAFETARKAATRPADSAPQSGIFTAYQEFKPPPNISEPASEKWGEGPVRWIMTGEEKKRWAQLSSGSERAEFVDRFWEARNPRPGSPDNTFRTTFERRVAFADATFPQDEQLRGSLTDRGMVFVLLGPPTYIGRAPLTTREDTSSAAGMSTVTANDVNAALRDSGGTGKTTSAKQASTLDRMTGPTSTAIGSEANWREIWHYRKELLPAGVPYHQVDVEFITKKGYGQNVLQRGDSKVLSTLELSRKAPKS